MMAGAIGDINQGIVSISHTSGTENADLPAKTSIKPSSSNILVHTESALNLEDSSNHIMKFVRGNQLDSYTPQEQRDFRQNILQELEQQIKNTPNDAPETAHLNALATQLKNDAELEKMATMARNVLISA